MKVVIDLPRGSERAVAQAAQHLLEALICVNLEILRSQPVVPLYRSGVQYRAEPPGPEHFDHIGIVLARGWGDCDDLVCWRCAELRFFAERQGIPAGKCLPYGEPRIIWPKGQRHYHAQLRRIDRSVEDPAAALKRMNGVHP